MTTGFLNNADNFLRGLIPVALALFFVVLSVLPYGVPFLATIFPALALISVYYWSIHRPELFPATAVFAVGFIQDILSGSPLGLTAFVLLLVHGFIVNQRRVFLGKPFLVAWWGFGLVAIGATLASWLIASMFNEEVMEPFSVFMQLCTTVAVFPAFSWLFARLQRSVMRQQ